jgi:hypothetical protein
MTEAAYATIQILKAFPDITIPDNEPMRVIGAEQQALTMVLSPANGCKVDFGK